MPDLDILTPSWNSGPFLEDAIDSVRALGPLEPCHYVLDGASDDETLSILRSATSVQWTSEPDKGQSDALNKGLRASDSQWVGWLNADEFYLPGGLERLLGFAIREGFDVVYGDAIIVDETGRFLKLLPQHRFSTTILRWYGPFPSSCATVFRRKVLEPDPWDAGLKAVMDWDLYLNLVSRRATFAYLPVVVGAFRYHEQRATLRYRDIAKLEREQVRARYGISSLPGLEPVGHTWHRVQKLLQGSYTRQLQARRYAGQDARWFASATSLKNVRALASHLNTA